MTLGVVVVGIISDCGRCGEGVLTTAVAIAIVVVAGVVDDLTGYLPVIALTATLGVVHQCGTRACNLDLKNS